ncbi:MAG TPA: TlpA disulfide reductase family protein [Burkholderiaceae bacterium]|nr:TlpA disulfide reductase family protein [Burkholderiaceae bacterium]
MWRWPAAIAWGVFGVTVAVVAAVAYQEFFASRDEPNSIARAPATVAGGALSIRRAEKPRPVPELHFMDALAKPHTLSEFNGRVVLLNIWATWCVPCRKEMPGLDRLQAMLGGPQFEVVALSIDRDGVLKVKEFYKELGLQRLGIYVDTGGDVTTKLGAVGVPLTLLVDRQGNELWRVLGPAEWDQPAMVDTIRKEIGAPAK